MPFVSVPCFMRVRLFGVVVTGLAGATSSPRTAVTPAAAASVPCSTGDPAWSPEGGLIAFAASAGPNSSWQIRAVRPNGSGLRTLTNKPHDDPPYVTWTHDFEPR